MNEVQQRLQVFIKHLGITNMEFEQTAKLSNGFLTNTNEKMRKGSKLLIEAAFPQLNLNWLIKGEGKMLNDTGNTINSYGANSANAINGNASVINNSVTANRKVPLFDDVATIGGTQTTSDLSVSKTPSDFIDTGDWFRDATAVIRHYGDSMVEYPSGSLLAIKRVEDYRLLMWGRNYCIETTEFRVTKRLQDGGDDFFLGYSSNTETYQDGTLIYAPIKIPKDSIRSIDLVLGCVTKEYSNGTIKL